MNLKDISIGRRLITGFAILTTLLIIAGVTGMWGATHIKSKLNNVFEQRLPALDYLIEADRDLQQLLVAERSMIFSNANSDTFEALIAEYEENLDQAKERVGKYAALAQTEKEKEVLKAYEEARNEWLEVSTRIVEGRKADTREGRRLALDLSLGEAREKFEAMRSHLDVLTGQSLELAARDARDAQDVYLIILFVILGLTAFSVILAIFLGSRITRSITRPLAEIVSVSEAMAQGDLSRKITYDSKDEVGQLAESLRGMLSGVIGEGQSIKNGIMLPMFITDEEGVLIYGNQGVYDLIEAMSKRPISEVLNKMSVSEALPSVNDTTGKEVRRCIQTGDPSQTEHKLVINSQELALIAMISPLRDLDGNITGAMGIGLDITEQKNQLEQLSHQQSTMKNVADRASSISDNLADRAQAISTQVDKVNRGAELQSERTAETVTAMEEMNASVLEVARNASDASESAKNARQQAEQGAKIVNDVVNSVTEVQSLSLRMKESLNSLGEQAEGIGQVMNVITDIADQTNLLALNAAIEAARAGDAGRGFAVVADEVRKLAEKTMSATKEVGEAVSAIQEGTRQNIAEMDEAANATTRSTELAQQGGDALKEIVEIVTSTTDQISSIATASDEQSAASEQISRSVEEISQISTETASGMSEADHAIKELADLAAQLKELIKDLHQ